MNSLLQQLYHIPSFSLQLLGLAPDRRRVEGGGDDDDADSGAVVSDVNQAELREEDEVLQQLQVLCLVIINLTGMGTVDLFIFSL